MIRLWNTVISQWNRGNRPYPPFMVLSVPNLLSILSKMPCRKGLLCAGLFSSLLNSPDFDEPINEDELHDKYVNRDALDWKERLNLMWRRDQYHTFSPELEFCSQAGIAGCITGLILGAFKESRHVYMKFIAANKQTMFKHPREAQAIMQEQVTYHMMKGGFRWGTKVGAFVFIYVTLCQTAHTIRNWVNPLDHAVSGFATGSLLRVLGGPKAMLGSGILGFGMGLSEGAMTWTLYKISGETISERWLRELRQIKVYNAAKDEAMLNIRRSEIDQRYTQEEWEAETEKIKAFESTEKSSSITDLFRDIFIRVKELAAPPNINVTFDSEDVSTNLKDSASAADKQIGERKSK